ncbi:MAG: DUF3089 domain-containing protein [Deltaproteobacteria bacterium]|nr:DUF3089 domain-containing protein [Deltaproteobacteria bacterium]
MCHPERASDICRDPHEGWEVLPDGSRVPLAPVAVTDVPADCFYVYPTVDLSPIPAVQDDFSDRGEQERATRMQAAVLWAACRVYAPLYRQVTLGTYVADPGRVQGCFDTAYHDVERAFDAYLASVPADRPLVLVGHSQGGQVVSRLLRERVDPDPALRARLAGALPIGWPVGRRRGELLGGTSQTVPVCTADGQAGCLVGFRTYGAGQDFPDESARLREGDEGVCVHPGDAADGGPRLLRGALLNARFRGVVVPPDGVEPGSDVDLLYRDYFSARCVEREGGHALEVRAAPAAGDVRANPVNFNNAFVSGFSGSHILDVPLTALDLVERVRRMVAAHGS